MANSVTVLSSFLLNANSSLFPGHQTRVKVKVKLKLLSRVRLFATPWTVAYQTPLSAGILQTRIPEWVAMPSSRRSSTLGNQTRISYVSCTGGWVLYHYCHLGSPKLTGDEKLSCGRSLKTEAVKGHSWLGRE